MAPKVSSTAQRGSALKAAGRSVSTPLTVSGARASASSAGVPATCKEQAKAARAKSSAVSVNAAERRSSGVGKTCFQAGPKSMDSRKVAAAIHLQAWFRGHLGRCYATRYRMRIEQRRLEERYEREEQARRQAAATAKREAEEAAKLEKERQKDARLRAYRDRRGAAELMCQALPSQTMPWEEDASKLLELLETSSTCNAEDWLGRQSSRRAARKQYLLLARKWHPDKWSMQGEASVAVATEVTKCLVRAYEWMNKNLPAEDFKVSCEDEDEEAEVFEFASWVGVAFEGMFKVYKERKGVTRGN